MAVDRTKVVAGGASVLIGSDLGAIKGDGITITPTIEQFQVDIEQEAVHTKTFATKRRVTMEFTLCEPILENIKISWDCDNAIAAGPPRTLSIIDQQFNVTERVIVVTGTTPGFEPFLRSITAGRAVVETPGPLVLSKNQEQNQKIVFLCLADATAKALAFSDAQS